MEYLEYRWIPWSTAGQRLFLHRGGRGVVAGVFLFEIISGLAVSFGRFSPAIEWGLILHTALGLLAVAPFAWYLVKHWKDFTDQALSDVLLLGYVGAGALAVCVLTGLLITGQALIAFEPRPRCATSTSSRHF